MQYRSQRYDTNLTVNVMVKGRAHQCLLENVSESGGRLSGVPELILGDEIYLTCSLGVAAGVVKWARNGQCGIEFRPRISKALVTALCRDGATMTGARFHSNALHEM